MSKYRNFQRTDIVRGLPDVDWAASFHAAGMNTGSRVWSDGRDLTTLPVETWPEYYRSLYARGWRPDRFGDDPATIPLDER